MHGLFNARSRLRRFLQRLLMFSNLGPGQVPVRCGAARQQNARDLIDQLPAPNDNNAPQNRRTGFVQKDKLRLVSTRLRCLNRTIRS
jgi:hypothetical protein